MKKIFVQVCSLLLCLLFTYAATSKFLEYDKFVFQMQLAPVPLMKIFGPILGWLIPSIESAIVIVFVIGVFNNTFERKGLYASVILLTIFETYIATMLLSGSDLPCTCGGLISTMGWKQHLIFNGIFITAGCLALNFSKNIKNAQSKEHLRAVISHFYAREDR